MRTLLGLTALVACGLGLWLVYVEPYRRQETARKELAGSVVTIAAKPAFLAPIVGKDRYHQVVEFRAPAVTRSGSMSFLPVASSPRSSLRHLADLVYVERLYLDRTDADDSTALQIGRLSNLKRLSLWRTETTDLGLRSIGQCTKLQALDLHETYVTDDGLAALEQLSDLRFLKLGTPIQGPGLRSVAKLPRLAVLDLSQTTAGSDDLAELAGSSIRELVCIWSLRPQAVPHLLRLPNLRILRGAIEDADDATAKAIATHPELVHIGISGTTISDEATRQLCRRNLHHLTLHGNLTDATLKEVESCKSLREINLVGRFSLAAIEHLVQARPELTGWISTHAAPTPANSVGGLARTGLTIESLISRAGNNGDEILIRWPATIQDYLSDHRFEPSCRALYLMPQGNQLPASSLVGLEKLPNLQELGIPPIGREDMSRLAEARNLQRIVWYNTRLTDDDLREVNLPPMLHELRMGVSELAGAGVAELQSRYPQVRISANVPHTSETFYGAIETRSLERIVHHPEVREVELRDLIENVSLDPLASLPNLEELALRGVGHRDARWTLTKDLPTVKRLRLEGFFTGDRELAQLTHFPNVEVLVLQGTSVSERGFQHVAGLTHLRELTVSGGGWITGRGLAALADCPRLERLNLTGVQISGEWLSALTGLKHLKQIDLPGGRVVDRDCEAFSRMPALEVLDLGYTAITDAGVASLAECHQLSRLNLGYTAITDAALRHLADAPRLLELDVRETRTTPAGRAALQSARPGLRLEPGP